MIKKNIYRQGSTRVIIRRAGHSYWKAKKSSTANAGVSDEQSREKKTYRRYEGKRKGEPRSAAVIRRAEGRAEKELKKRQAAALGLGQE